MTSYGNTRFPMTVWPGLPLPTVPVTRSQLTVLPDGRLDWLGGEPDESLPEEWVLRQLLDADLDDDSAVERLLGYGVIQRPFFDPRVAPDAARSRMAPLPAFGDGPEWWSSRSDGTLEDARWWLKTAAALASVWGAAAMGDPMPHAAWERYGFRAGYADKWPWTRFTDALNIGLRPFRAHAETTISVDGGREHVAGRPRIDLFNAAVAQIFNLVAAGATGRRCANESCGRVFVHQISDIEYRQHRRSIGLRFCTDRCARAQASREYRRRKASQSKETER